MLSALSELVKGCRVPGIVVVVKRDGVVVHEQAEGFADLESRLPMSPSTPCPLASVSKQFTAVAVMILVERGLIDLAVPLSRFAPFAPASWDQITISNLLCHTSGLPDYLHGNLDLTRDRSTEDLLRMIARRPLRFQPGSRWEYSNSGYMALGHIVEKVASEPFGGFVLREVASPAGMRNAAIMPSQMVIGYEWDQGWVQAPAMADSLQKLGDGMMVASALDLVSWNSALGERRILRPETWQAMWTPHPLSGVPGYGMGWNIERPGPNPRLSHRGEFGGATAWMVSDLQTDSCQILLANADDVDLRLVEQGMCG